jgi:hypothetical protein
MAGVEHLERTRLCEKLEKPGLRLRWQADRIRQEGAGFCKNPVEFFLEDNLGNRLGELPRSRYTAQVPIPRRRT